MRTYRTNARAGTLEWEKKALGQQKQKERMPRRGIGYPEPNMPHAHTMLGPVTPAMQKHPFALP